MKRHIISYAIIAVILSISMVINGSSTEKVISKKAGINEVVIHETGNPDKIFPALSHSANSSYMESHIFQSLLEIDPATFEYIPVLAKERPIMAENTNGGFDITYEIRPEAVWENGTPITAKDVAFTIKMIKNPNVDCAHLRNYYEFITDLVFYPENEKKFTIVTKDKYFMSEIWSGVTIYPEYHYDPEGLMRETTIAELNDPEKKVAHETNELLRAFADQIHLEKYGVEPEYVNGSGAYRLASFEFSDQIELERKKDWWGNELAKKGIKGFEANPEKITFKVINDWSLAIETMKNEEIDVSRSIRHRDFEKLHYDEEFQKLFNLHTESMLSYNYLGLNMKHPILSDKKVRQALSYATNYEYIIDVIAYSFGYRTVGPIHPSKSYYHNDLEMYNYDLEKAKELLAEAGWQDSDADGILDKKIDGVKTPLKLDIRVVYGSATSGKIALKIQEDCKSIGMDITVSKLEWTVFLERNKTHDFDIYMGGWVSAPTVTDMKQIWHSESYDGGSNYVGFGDEKTDEIIEKIRYENDEAKRLPLYHEMQEIIHEEAPYVFLYVSRNRLAIHKRFDNANAYVARPGYKPNEFILNESFGK